MMFYLAKLTIVTILICDMYKDGYWKRTGRLLYPLKLGMYLSILAFGLICYYDSLGFLFDWEFYACIIGFKLPISNIAYNLGNGKPMDYVGTQNYWDKKIRSSGILNIKAPILLWIYLILIFVSLCFSPYLY